MNRAQVEQCLQNVLRSHPGGMRHVAAETAISTLLDYIDDKAGPAQVVGESEAFELFRTFVRQNAKALRMVAHWGDGRCGALLEVLVAELQHADSTPPASCKQAAGTTPMFAEEGTG